MSSATRPKRTTREPERYKAWEEGQATMTSERKRKSREKNI